MSNQKASAKKTDFLEVLKEKTPGVLTTTAGVAIGFAGLKMVRDKMNLQGLGTVGDVIGAVTSNQFGQYVPNAILIVGSIIGSVNVKNPHLQSVLIGVAIAGLADAANRASGKNYFLGGVGAVNGFSGNDDEEFGYIEDEFGAIKKFKKFDGKSKSAKRLISRTAPVVRTPSVYDLAGAEYVDDEVMAGLSGDEDYLNAQMNEQFTQGIDDYSEVEGLGATVELA